MMTRRTGGVGIALEEAERRFERWRKARSPHSRSPIPKALWALAVEVAQEYGLNPTTRTLRLNHTALKEHVRATDRRRSQPPSTTLC
jgi:hypothetical protein